VQRRLAAILTVDVVGYEIEYQQLRATTVVARSAKLGLITSTGSGHDTSADANNSGDASGTGSNAYASNTLEQHCCCPWLPPREARWVRLLTYRKRQQKQVLRSQSQMPLVSLDPP